MSMDRIVSLDAVLRLIEGCALEMPYGPVFERLAKLRDEIVALPSSGPIDRATVRHRNYTIEYNPKPIPSRLHDWDWVHDDYDGPGDPRCGAASSVEAAKAEIDELEDDR